MAHGMDQHSMTSLWSGHILGGSCFCYAGTSGGTFYRHFKLASCQPDTAAAAVDSADDIAVGRIQLDLCEVTPTGCNRPVRGRGALPQSEADKRLPEGKKWFMAPGLKVSMAVPTILACHGCSMPVRSRLPPHA
jgi:hypothetical protein